MVGGPEATFERVKPLFELMGKNITLVGGNGDGQTTKVANQIIVALNIAAVGEALVFASKAGADPAKVRQALMGGFASSRILEVHGERMIKRTFDPGFRIGLHQKDLSLALAGARALGVALPQTAGAAQLMQACAANGMADLDHSALVRALELMAEPRGREGVTMATDRIAWVRVSSVRAAAGHADQRRQGADRPAEADDRDRDAVRRSADGRRPSKAWVSATPSAPAARGSLRTPRRSRRC